MFGKFASYSGTSVPDVDLKDVQWSENVDVEIFNCNKLTFIADNEVSVKINDSAQWCPLYLDPSDSKYKISFDSNDIKIKNFYVNDTVTYWVGFLY
jgi:hypothetical protein